MMNTKFSYTIDEKVTVVLSLIMCEHVNWNPVHLLTLWAIFMSAECEMNFKLQQPELIVTGTCFRLRVVRIVEGIRLM